MTKEKIELAVCLGALGVTTGVSIYLNKKMKEVINKMVEVQLEMLKKQKTTATKDHKKSELNGKEA